MAGISTSTIGNVGGAVQDLFSAFGDIAQGDLKAKGLNIQAEGLRLKAKGDLAEASNYDLASTLAQENKQFTTASTAIQQSQMDRNNYLQIGGQRADIAGAGFTEGGSALDILADSARQGALSRAVLGQQGHITEAGYQEQADSYTTLASTARATAEGEMHIAGETDQLAADTKSASEVAAAGDIIGSAFKIGAAILPFAL